jgi:hypothetical protein
MGRRGNARRHAGRKGSPATSSTPKATAACADCPAVSVRIFRPPAGRLIALAASYRSAPASSAAVIGALVLMNFPTCSTGGRPVIAGGGEVCGTSGASSTRTGIPGSPANWLVTGPRSAVIVASRER